MAKSKDAGPVAKRQTSFNLPVDLVEQALDAAWWGRLSLAELAEEALRREIRRLARKAGYSSGVFPTREGNLKSGRPIRSPVSLEIR